MAEMLTSEGHLIDKPYAYHKPSPEGLDKVNRLRAAFSFVEREIQACCADSRQKSIAITNNEQTAMWAIKAVVFNDPKSEVDIPLTSEDAKIGRMK